MPTQLSLIKGQPAQFTLTVPTGYTLRVSLLNQFNGVVGGPYALGAGLTTVTGGGLLLSLPGTDTGKLTVPNAYLALELSSSGGSELEETVPLLVKPNFVV